MALDGPQVNQTASLFMHGDTYDQKESMTFYFVQSVLPNCGPNIFPYGPHNWSIRA